MKKISVIIPFYNAIDWFEKSFTSLTNQTIFNDLEIIYVNDGSTDSTEKKLKKMCKNIDNVIVVDKINGGVSSARNVGIEKSTCKYISFLDIDDYIDSDYFETLYKYRNFDIVSSGFVAEYLKKAILNKVTNEIIINSNIDIIKDIIVNSNINHNCWGKLFKKKLINNIRFDENLKYSEDYLFVFEYLLNCKNSIIIPYSKYHYVINNVSAMRKNFNYNRFMSVKVAEKVTSIICEKYPSLIEHSKSKEIDTKCRILADIYYFNKEDEYSFEVKNIYEQIKRYSLIKKFKYSSKKHFLAFLAMRISPKLYIFIKKTLKFEYKR